MQAVSKRMYKDMRKCNDSETGINTCSFCMHCYGDVICMLHSNTLAWMRCGQRMVSDIKASSFGRSEPLKHTVRENYNIFDDPILRPFLLWTLYFGNGLKIMIYVSIQGRAVLYTF